MKRQTTVACTVHSAVTLNFNPLTRKPNQYVSRSRDIMWPDFREISSSSIYKYIAFIRFFGSLPAV